MDSFTIILKKTLINRLPQTVEYEWSRVIEGAMESNNAATWHKHVTIIVDNEVNDDGYKAIAKKLAQFLRRNEYFRYSKYRVLLWKQNSFSPITLAGRGVSALLLNKLFDELVLDGTASGNWDNYRVLYKPHRLDSQVLLITTREKVEALRQLTALGIKNLVILYPALTRANMNQTILRIPCIADIEN